MVGVNRNVEAQKDLLRLVASEFFQEYDAISDSPSLDPTVYSRHSGFSGMDGALLYSMVRRYKPRQILEIGSGNSTLLSLLALQRNREENPEHEGSMTSIEPYPEGYLRQSLEGRGRLIQKRVEEVPLEEFGGLEENDILFIDSTHTVKIGCDVLYELLEIVPRLRPGVLIHLHDIFLPFEYPRDWVMRRKIFWAEQYLLHAFLAYNESFEILWSPGIARAEFPELLKQTFPYFDPEAQDAGSFWMRKVRP
jgi:predicted O-methyltransferase YrrM